MCHERTIIYPPGVTLRLLDRELERDLSLPAVERRGLERVVEYLDVDVAD